MTPKEFCAFGIPSSAAGQNISSALAKSPDLASSIAWSISSDDGANETNCFFANMTMPPDV
jgi:hypothetical protein